MLKNLFLALLAILFLASCAGTQTTFGVGVPTHIHSLDQRWKGDTHKIGTVSTTKDNWELAFNTYYYDMKDEKFTTQSIGVLYHLRKEWGWFFVDGGAGLHLGTKDKDNYLLAHSNLLGDIKLSVGVKKEFEKFRLECMYTLQHISVPFRSDRGLNYDMVRVGITIPF